MASIVTFSLNTKFSINPISSSSSQLTPIKLTSQFIRFGYLGSCRTTRKLGANSGSKTTLRSCRTTRKPGANSGSKITSWFRFGSNGVDAEGAGIYGSQSRDDFDRDDVEQYFNYMGMLAVEGTYDKMEVLLNQNIHPVDILLLMAASEGDKPKIEELLRAGADYTVKDGEGRTALDRAASDEVKDLIQSFSAQRA